VAQSNHETRADWRGTALTLAAGVLAVVALDQATKTVVAARMSLGESVPVIPGLLHFTLVHNTGMAFGLLSGADVPYKSMLMTLGALVALGAVAYYAIRSPQGEKLTRFVLILILGGAIGNILDRVRLGYVIDFVDVFYRDSHWPAFNVADASISIGVGLLLLESLRKRETALPRAADAATGGDR
jgi:signal peptidase II